MMKMTEIADINLWWQLGKDFAAQDVDLKNLQGKYFQFRNIDLSLNNLCMICGPRQVGKTVYLKKIIDHLLHQNFPPRQIYYLNAELFIAATEVEKALEYFFEANRNKPQFYIFLDNLTLLRGWTDLIRRIISQGLIRNGTLIITGSQQLTEAEKTALLMEPQTAIKFHYLRPLSFNAFARQVASLYGANLTVAGGPVDFSAVPAMLEKVNSYCFHAEPERLTEAAESLKGQVRELELLFNEYCATGGFPAAINEHFTRPKTPFLEKHGSAEIFLQSILADCSRQDRKASVARHLIKLILNRYGSRFSYLLLARELEIMHVTVIQYLSMLERQFLTETTLAYDFRKGQPKFKGDKKVYIPDAFILSALQWFATGQNQTEIPVGDAEINQHRDRIVRGIIISHLRRHLGHDQVWFYYDLAGKEIDTIVGTSAGYYGIHVDYGETGGLAGRKRIAAVANYLVLGHTAYRRRARWHQLPAPVFLALLSANEKIL